MLEKYATEPPSNIDELTCANTSFRYVTELSGRNIYCDGLLKRPESVLIDKAIPKSWGWSKEDLDYLHDHCAGVVMDRDYPDYKEWVAETSKDLKKRGLPVPTYEDIIWAGGFSYPGSRTYAFEHKGHLVIT